VLERTKRARYGLGAERRLTQSVVFERLLKRGARKSVAGFTFYLGRRDEGPPRLGILVSRKHSARATDRNRIKRCIREAFRLEQESLGPIDVLVRPPYGVEPCADMILRLRELLSRLNR
jgi:ribonuclease P protein component